MMKLITMGINQTKKINQTWIIRISLSIILVLMLVDSSFATEEGNIISLQVENDFFGERTDRHFTHGTRLVYLTKPLKWMTEAANMIPWFFMESESDNSDNALRARGSLSIGQNIYTPEDISNDQLILTDRPYAGWLYLGFGVVTEKGSSRYDQLKLEIGLVGPASQAEEVQTFFHSLWGMTIPRGWDNQIKNEPGFNLYYEQIRRLAKHRLISGFEMDLLPHFGGSLGNVFTYGACGITARIGRNLKNDFGPPRIRPSLPGGGFFQQDKKLNWYLFIGAEGRLVFRNIFLDGNTFSDSHSVKKEIFMGDIQAGISMQINRFRLSYTRIFRGREFEEQNKSDVFGSISLSYQFH